MEQMPQPNKPLSLEMQILQQNLSDVMDRHGDADQIKDVLKKFITQRGYAIKPEDLDDLAIQVGSVQGMKPEELEAKIKQVMLRN